MTGKTSPMPLITRITGILPMLTKRLTHTTRAMGTSSRCEAATTFPFFVSARASTIIICRTAIARFVMSVILLPCTTTRKSHRNSSNKAMAPEVMTRSLARCFSLKSDFSYVLRKNRSMTLMVTSALIP